MENIDQANSDVTDGDPNSMEKIAEVIEINDVGTLNSLFEIDANVVEESKPFNINDIHESLVNSTIINNPNSISEVEFTETPNFTPDQTVVTEVMIATQVPGSISFSTGPIDGVATEILSVTPDGIFNWHKDAEKRIQTDNFIDLESMRHILKALWKVSHSDIFDETTNG